MPVLNISYPVGRLDAKTKSALAGKLTDVLIRMEGGANTPGGRGFAAVLFQGISEDDWWVGGKTDDTFVSPSGKFLVRVTIPEGYMNAAHKTEVHAWVTDAILEVTGSADHSGSNSIQVILDEVPEGNWGAGGRTISLESIAGTVGMSISGSRFAWVRSYFEAKAMQLKLFGYPDDMGGVLPSVAAKSRKSEHAVG
ncbi:tautomerase family protein [Bradyrhizobium symbiodeficiens]|uniref:Tautomerase family protein n=1 Tax=Bradyrhizobium symbiodeficiens TaxID=1404367 RepID=A0A6G9A0Q9_9BRAD|nr:tautomerase family protein [Bradyrhizobium symbiodeficiens]QIP05803.1 4-oxalocrotonate tautomerase [Bradyrhizobium symbiodeficiens]